MLHDASRHRFVRIAAVVLATAWGAGVLGAPAGKSSASDRPGRDAPADRAATPAADSGPGGIAARFWIDPRQHALPHVPWRKVIIEYHNSQHMPRLGDRFDADEFGDRLLAANINGATVFAKDMFGYSYYPSKCGPVHPGLSFDLLDRRVHETLKTPDQ